ncbi:MAG: low temperature requirement protein A [Candidatus Nomurabacteria bacterium]|nr:MAG: low temperature requirement protein A [Candidatus Nomurabacteria bacterium]
MRELIHALADQPDWSGVLRFVLLFIPIWWVWIGHTLYNDRFETDDVSHKLLTFLMMLPIAGLAIFARDGLDSTAFGFGVSYILARLVLIFLWIRGGYHNPEIRKTTGIYSIGFSTSVILWTISLFVPAPLQLILRGLGLAIDLFTPALTFGEQSKLPRFSNSHLPERFGLLVIIVLGETIIATAEKIADLPVMTTHSLLIGGLGMLLAFGLWWLYFNTIPVRRVRQNEWVKAAWGYGHLPLHIGTGAIGAAMLAIIANGANLLRSEIIWLLCGGAAITLLFNGLLELTLVPDQHDVEHKKSDRGIRFGGALLIILVGTFAPRLGATFFLLALSLLMLGQVIHGIVHRYDDPECE